MSELTKEYFDKHINQLVTKDDLEKQTKELKAYTDEQTEVLAEIANKAFQGNQEYLDKRFTEVIKMLDVRQRMELLEKKFRKLEHALNVKL